jgi:hypothetical protein
MHENQKANMLAQQASGYDVGGHNFHIKNSRCMKIYIFAV